MEGTLSQLLTVAFLVIVVSMVVAVVIKAITAVLDRFARPRTPTLLPAAAASSAAVPDWAGGPGPDGRPPEEHVAVIAAAVSVIFDDGAQIVHIQPGRADTSWAASGRHTLHSSHHLGPRTTRRPNAPRTHD